MHQIVEQQVVTITRSHDFFLRGDFISMVVVMVFWLLFGIFAALDLVGVRFISFKLMFILFGAIGGGLHFIAIAFYIQQFYKKRSSRAKMDYTASILTYCVEYVIFLIFFGILFSYVGSTDIRDPANLELGLRVDGVYTWITIAGVLGVMIFLTVFRRFSHKEKVEARTRVEPEHYVDPHEGDVVESDWGGVGEGYNPPQAVEPMKNYPVMKRIGIDDTEVGNEGNPSGMIFDKMGIPPTNSGNLQTKFIVRALENSGGLQFTSEDDSPTDQN